MKVNNLTLLVVLLGTMISANAQEKKLEYNIKRNGDVVGNIHFIQGIAGNRTVLTMESEVNTRFIFNFKAKAKEEVIYDNGIMTWSSIFRKLNGNVKVDKKTKANGSAYTVYKGSKTEMLNNYPIRYNMLSVYIIEPVNVTKVYSDNFQQQIDIQKVDDHHYKIKFPDGNYNEYFYTNGICSKVEVHHSLYSATIELKS
jgi:Domain of unknown function (DUF6134)